MKDPGTALAGRPQGPAVPLARRLPAKRRRGPILGIALAAGLVVSPPVQGQAGTGLRVYISADMEGITGVVTGAQLGPSGFEYGRFREFMTAEVVAAIEGALAAGADEILVSDSHGNGQNLLIDRLPEDVQIIRAWPRPLGMMEGIDESFDAALFIGYHASTTNPNGVRAHTFSSANYAAVRLNGIPMPEAGVNAAIAGHFGVPVALVSGDDAIVEEAEQIVGEIEGVTVKESLGFHSARTFTPARGQRLIREGVERALSRLGDFTPYTVDSPVVLDVTFKSYTPAEIAAYLPSVERVDAHTIRFVGQDMVEVSRFLQFLGGYSAGLVP
ncbi:MAG: M55 family metallopeptidase [Gemmatimonadetes bacterium]|nr:M55 family metallopeptidase [Gemmatimonadota bacterium]NNM35384.1 M55 family metallopeptidase [Gemmatimonadota bacterium]